VGVSVASLSMGPVIEHVRRVRLQFVALVFCVGLAAAWMMRHPPKLRPNLGISVRSLHPGGHRGSGALSFNIHFFAFSNEILPEASSACRWKRQRTSYSSCATLGTVFWDRSTQSRWCDVGSSCTELLTAPRLPSTGLH